MRRIVIILATILISFLIAAGNGHAQSLPTDVARLTVTRSDDAGFSAVLDVPPPLLAAGSVGVAGLATRSAGAAAAALPFHALLIALPPGAEADVVVTPHQVTTKTVAPLLTAAPPDQAPARESVGLTTAGSGPIGWYTLDEPLTLRGYRFVSLQLYPVQYDAAAQTLTSTDRLDVRVTFVGSRPADPAPGQPDATVQAVLTQAVNGDRAGTWRAAAEPPARVGQPLPTDRTLYRIVIDEDGLYWLDYAALRAAGLPVDRLNPARLMLAYRGAPVAYEWIGDGDARFEPGEGLRFFGWAFDGPRAEAQYVTDNIFWLWVGDAGDQPLRVPTVVNPTGYPVAGGFRDVAHFEQERIWHPGWTDGWDRFPNDADAWFWHYFGKRGSSLSVTFPLTLTQPIAGGAPASVEIEWMGRREGYHSVEARLNAAQPAGALTWYGLDNVNQTADVPAAALRHGVNQLQLTVNSPGDDDVLLNRVSLAYTRRFEARDGVLHFVHNVEGQVQFSAGGLTSGNAADLLVWRIDNRHTPYRIGIAGGDVSGSGPYNVRVASYHEAGTEFYITSADRVRQPQAIEPYVPQSIWPPHGADWVAIAWPEFVDEAQRLADYRARAGQLRTFVVDVHDVIMQSGYGLPLPQAVQTYLATLAADPAVPLRYAVLVGDATLNPRGLACTGGPGACYSGWNGDEPAYVPTELLFVDRFIGQIPSDHLYMAVSGADAGPDIAVGRLTVRTPAELRGVIDKTIAFEQAIRASAPWTRQMLFVSDDTDAGGDFCQQNAASAAHVPDGLTARMLCLRDNPTVQDEAALRAEILAALANPGALLLNYRGHGSLTGWGAGDRIMSRSDVALWQNVGRPAVVVSADCLDGNFAWPGRPAYSEELLRLAGGGSAAHWSSTGLGYSYEHTVLNEGLFSGLFDHGLTTIGDAVLYAKWAYLASGHHRSQLAAFTLQGDPALGVAPPDLAVSQTVSNAPAAVGAQVTAHVTLRNNGILPTPAELTYTLPDGVTLHNPTLTPPIGTLHTLPNGLRVQFAQPLKPDEAVTLRATLRIGDVAGYGSSPYAVATARALLGRDLAGNDEAVVKLLDWPALAVTLRGMATDHAQWPRWLPPVLLALTAGTLLLRRRR